MVVGDCTSGPMCSGRGGRRSSCRVVYCPAFVAIGGGAHSSLWRQIIADVTGKSVERAGTDQAAALGAGILAAAGVGLFCDVRAAATVIAHRSSVRLDPSASNHRLYSCLHDEVYRNLFPALQPYLQRLTELAEETVAEENPT